MTLVRKPSEELDRPVESLTDLVAFLRSGEKPRERWRLGLEHEKLGIDLRAQAPVAYEGARGVEAVLRALARQEGWEPIEEGGRVVGLDGGEVGVSLEPGAQLEFDGSPLRSVREVCDQLRKHIESIRRVSDPLAIAWLGIGLQPFQGVDRAARVPRERYRIMREYLPTRGGLALEMMHCTASVQVSFDYSDESDMVAKFRAALAATPVVAALYANSPLAEGKPSGFVSRRIQVWQATDPDRTGLLPFVFEPDFGYRRYVEWSLDVPMFFLVRGERYLSMGGKTFRRFLAEGHEGERATLADFERHLTTLFPEVRLKRILEVRGMDAVPPGLVDSIPALWKGLLYDPAAREAALELLGGWRPSERAEAFAAVARAGLRARGPRGSLRAYARELVAIAREGLRRLGEEEGADETSFLDPLEPLLEAGRSPGELLLERWQGEWGGSPQRLIESVRY